MLGDSWVNLGRPNTGQVTILCLTDLGSGIVIATTNAPIGQISHYYRSTDYGITWSDIGTFVKAGRGAYLTDCGGGVVVAGRTRVEAYVERSTDYGLTWSYIKRLVRYLDGATVGCYCGSNIVLLGADTGGWLRDRIVYKSTDKGLTWDTGTAPTTDTMTAVKAMIYLGSGIALAGLENGEIARTTDAGATWAKAVGDVGANHVASFVDLGSGIVLCFEELGQLWKSTDYGATWASFTDLGQETFCAVYGNGMLFVGAGPSANVYRSIDDGVNFTDLGSLKTLFGIGSADIDTWSLLYGTDALGGEFLLAGLGGVDGDAYICRSSIAVAPTVARPTDLLCEQTKNPTNVTDPQPEFSAIYHKV